MHFLGHAGSARRPLTERAPGWRRKPRGSTSRTKASATVSPTVSRPWLRRMREDVVAEIGDQARLLVVVQRRAPRSRGSRGCLSTNIECCEMRQEARRAARTPPRRSACGCGARTWRRGGTAWMALWITKPACVHRERRTRPTFWPSRSIFTRLEAVISSKKTPVGVDEELVLGVRARAPMMCVKTRSSQPIAGHQPVGGGEVHAHGPFLGRHLALAATENLEHGCRTSGRAPLL